MITVEQIKEHIATQGLTASDLVIGAIAERVNSINDCLDGSYSENNILLIQLCLATILLISQGGRQISSQSGPSGASRSFKLTDLAEVQRSQIILLKSLDSNGCSEHLIPEEKSSGVKSFRVYR